MSSNFLTLSENYQNMVSKRQAIEDRISALRSGTASGATQSTSASDTSEFSSVLSEAIQSSSLSSQLSAVLGGSSYSTQLASMLGGQSTSNSLSYLLGVLNSGNADAASLFGTSDSSSLSNLLLSLQNGSGTDSGSLEETLTALLNGTAATDGTSASSSYTEAAAVANAAGSGVTKTASASTESSGTAVSVPSSLEAIFKKASQTYHVPENLLKAVAKAESNFNADAVSGAGAQGIMQLMPGTAKSLGVSDAFDPEQNIMGGAKYLSQMLERYNGNESLALAAYNAGPGNVDKYGGIPPFKETQNYVNRVLGYAGENITLPNTSVSNGNTTEATAESIQKSKQIAQLVQLEIEQALMNMNMNFGDEDEESSSLFGL